MKFTEETVKELLDSVKDMSMEEILELQGDFLKIHVTMVTETQRAFEALTLAERLRDTIKEAAENKEVSSKQKEVLH